MTDRARERALAVGLAALASTLLVLFFSPAWVAFRAWSRVPEVFWQVVPVRRGIQVMKQVVDPFAEIGDPLHKILQWRLLMPGIGHALGLSPWVVLALSPLGALLVLAVLVARGRARGGSVVECASLALVAGAGAWFFTSAGWLGYYDSWLVLGLLTVAWARNRWAVWLACALTPWVDERFVLGFPLALAVRWIASADGSEAALSPRGLARWLVRETRVALLVVGVWVVIRVWLAGRADSQSLDDYRRAVEFTEIPAWRLAFGSWEGLRVGWIPVLLAVPLLRRSGQGSAGLLLAFGIVATTLAALATSNDLSRSAALALPALPLGWDLLRDTARWRRWHIAPLLGAAALLLPANHVVSTFTVPIHGLWRELHDLEAPPPPYVPELYLEEARRLASTGERERALGQATVALRLAGRDSPVGERAREFLRQVRETRDAPR
jgi:hypothetical protein